MGELDGLKTMGVDVNPPYLGDWPYRIGQFVLNFGAIEVMTLQILALLDATCVKKMAGKKLSVRLDRIKSLIEQSKSLTAEDRRGILEAVSEVRSLAKERNRIAHNPALPVWLPGQDRDAQPPAGIGIPDLAELKFSNCSVTMNMDQLCALIDRSVTVGRRLGGTAHLLGGG